MGARLLEERFGEVYVQRQVELESAEAEWPADDKDELPIFVLDAMLPRQRMHLNVFEPRYRALVRRVLDGGRRFGMVGFGLRGTHQNYGVEVVMEDCVPQPDGRFLVTVVGARAFRIASVWEQPGGYTVAKVVFLNPEDETREQDVTEARELLQVVEDWETLVRVVEPRLLEFVRNSLGPRPPPERPGDLALWTAALVNPLPALRVAPEIRGDVLAAEVVSERLRIVRRGVEASVSYLQSSARSPLRRLSRMLPPPGSQFFGGLVLFVALAWSASSSNEPWMAWIQRAVLS